MSSKMVTRQYDLTALAAGAALENAPAVAAKLNELLAAHARADGPVVDWQASIDQVGRFLQDTARALLDRDASNERTRTRQIQLREQRDLAAEKVRAELRSLRFLFDEVFGKEKSLRLFPARRELSFANPQNLLRSAKELAELLRSDRITWPTEPVGRHLVPPAELAASLEASSAALEEPLEALRPKKRAGEVARNVKNEGLAVTTDVMRRGTDFLVGVYRLAGLDEAAARLREGRSRRRPAAPEGSPKKGQAASAGKGVKAGKAVALLPPAALLPEVTVVD